MAERILFADAGTTFTKASLLERNGSTWRVRERAWAPTTVDSPYSDVMIGLRRAIAKLERLTGIRLLSHDRLIPGTHRDQGAGQFMATSSAGGGLQVLVAGLTEQITAESGHRAALGAGAVVTEVVSLNQANTDFGTLERLRNVPCDMVLLTGGVDGGNISDVLTLAQLLALAAPKPRFDAQGKTPLVYAGNVDARGYLESIVGDSMELICIDNIRPTMETELLHPVRSVIQEIFLRHVMSGAPGFKTLAIWAQDRVQPTPVAIGSALTQFAREGNRNILAVDVGGATTDVFSVIDGELYRSVSANIGMSYSIGNVLEQISPGMIDQWLPWIQDDGIIRNWHLNKMIRPSTLPQTAEELVLEQCFAKEAVSLSLEHHRSIVTSLKGIKISRQIGDVFTQHGTGHTLVNLMATDAIVGLGGVIANAPRLSQAVSILLDGVQPEGITDIFIDQDLCLACAGLVSTGNNGCETPFCGIQAPNLAGTCIAPVGPQAKPGTVMAEVVCGGDTYHIVAGEISVIPSANVSGNQLGTEISVLPHKRFDVGAGPGQPMAIKVRPSQMGLILDGRGRPIVLPSSPHQRVSKLREWYSALGVYPGKVLGMEGNV